MIENNLRGFFLDELVFELENLGLKKFRAKQIFNYFHKEIGDNIQDISTLSKKDIQLIASKSFSPLKLIDVFKSKDGTRKYIFQLQDYGIIETVYMPYKNRATVCISTQLGCRMGCSFCASGKLGKKRDLKAYEILEEFYYVIRDARRENFKVPDHIVIMGIGEPLDNYDEVIRFIRLLTCSQGYNLSMRNITISTCGLVDKIYKLADEGLALNLAISLHASTDEKRAKTMPIANKYKISEIMDAVDYYFDKTGRRISFEYVVLPGINDLEEDALELSKFLSSSKYHINLIGLNETKEFNVKASSSLQIENFKILLKKYHINATVRTKKGDDIEAACGQLRMAYEINSR